jgi:hypothetical protein
MRLEGIQLPISPFQAEYATEVVVSPLKGERQRMFVPTLNNPAMSGTNGDIRGLAKQNPRLSAKYVAVTGMKDLRFESFLRSITRRL